MNALLVSCVRIIAPSLQAGITCSPAAFAIAGLSNYHNVMERGVGKSWYNQPSGASGPHILIRESHHSI